MIPKFPDQELNLGRDAGWMNDDDAARQRATVERLLEAFCGPLRNRREIQLLADEVGMGKTFVALATAYALLSVLRRRESGSLDDLDGCYRCVLVITPAGNHPLAKKWWRETEAMLSRCSMDKDRTAWFQSKLCHDADQLLQAVQRANDLRRKEPVILVAEANIFTKRLSNVSARFLIACLFRFWGNAMPKSERPRLVRGLADSFGSDWDDLCNARGDDLDALWDWKEHERVLNLSESQREEEKQQKAGQEQRFRFWMYGSVGQNYSQVREALERLALDERARGELNALREQCLNMPQRANHSEWPARFDKLKDDLRKTYKALWPYLLTKHFPLVIADEAHHWRNGGQGARNFSEYLAPSTRRLLMLTATPFQLHCDELKKVLDVSQSMAPAIGPDRCAEFNRLKEALASAMTGADSAGVAFSKEWGRLGEQFALIDPKFSAAKLRVNMDEGDERIDLLQDYWSHATQPNSAVGDASLDSVPPELRAFFAAALKMKSANDALTRTMQPIIVRHRRRTEHRRYWIGREYPPAPESVVRPDQTRLHLAPGAQIPEDAELVQYLLMKAVAALHRGHRKTALCTSLTGSYSTMWSSQDGRSAQKAFEKPENRALFGIIKNLTGGDESAARKKDVNHPKLRKVVDEILRRWDMGEKSLVFCFRVPTAQALERAIAHGIDLRLKSKRRALLKARGTEAHSESDASEAMQQFRSSLTAREGTGVPLFLDRVLLAWCVQHEIPISEPTDADLRAVATLCLRARSVQRQKERTVFASFERLDRVFLHRTLEHVMAQRMLNDGFNAAHLSADDRDCTHSLLERIGRDPNWMCRRYGLTDEASESFDGEATAEQAARSSLNAKYYLDDEEPDEDRIGKLADVIKGRLDTLWHGPNLLVPRGDAAERLDDASRQTVSAMRRIVVDLSRAHDDAGWIARRQILDGLVRALLREDILLRLPTDVFKDKEETWSESLLRGIHTVDTATGRHESLAVRVLDFVRQLKDLDHKERSAALSYALKASAKAVELVSGSNHADRDEIFSGFNTPLLPDVLVCTQVGQEGIDLHRQCRHVIHYDLGWNPATVEQRTGRVDRLGSMAMRERRLARERDAQQIDAALPGLDIALPYLAGTYDERMFNVLRTRAQRFEILTGGDATADKEEETMWHEADDEGGVGELDLVPLPDAMLRALRVDLEVPRKKEVEVSK